MKIKIVKTATVEVIKPKELKVGDYILWGHFKCKVLSINQNWNDPKQFKQFVKVQQFEDDADSTLTLRRFLTFYRIIDCTTTEESI